MKEMLRIEKPQSVLDAAKSQKGLHIALELLIFVAVFLAVSVGEGILLVPGTLIMLFTNSEYLNAITTQDFGAIVEASTQIVSSNGYAIQMLFANAAMILIVLLFCKLIQKRKMNTLGFRKKGFLLEYLSGAVVGFVIFSVAVFICVLTGSLKLEGFSSTFTIGTFFLFTVGYMIQGMAEEVLCRGYFLVSVGRRYSMLTAIIANSLFFAALHLANSGISLLAFVNLILFGVFASVYFVKRDNIWGIGALHSVWNLVQGNVYGIRVSGMQTSCTVFSSEMTEGKELVNGGAFGLEGGLAVTIVLLAGIVILLCMKGKNSEAVQGE